MRNVILILILAFTLPFIGCRSGDQEKLVGTWKQIPYTNPEEASDQNMWIFTGGNELTIKTISTEEIISDSVVNEYTYDIDGDKLRIFDGLEPHNGEYWVDVLDKEYLKMTKKKSSDGKAAWVRYEFVKE